MCADGLEEDAAKVFRLAGAYTLDSHQRSDRRRPQPCHLAGQQLGLAAVLLVGGHQAINGSITVGEFIAFYGYVLMLTGPMRWLGMARRALEIAAV